MNGYLESGDELLARDSVLLVLVEQSKQVDRANVFVRQKLNQQLERVTTKNWQQQQQRQCITIRYDRRFAPKD